MNPTQTRPSCEGRVTTTRVTKPRRWFAAVVRVPVAAVALTACPFLLAAPSGAVFLGGCGSLVAGVVLLFGPSMTKGAE